jgi:hypothetical protein
VERERDAVRQLVGRDPRRTVYLMGMPQGQPGELYTARLRDMLRHLAQHVHVSFDDTK